jgi:CRP-like cAMP-binding protein
MHNTAKSGRRNGQPQGCSLRSHRLRRLKPLTPTLSPAVHSAMLSMLHCCTSDLKRRRVYFPSSGIISLVVELSSRPTIETAMIGRDSVCGGASALNAGISSNTSIVQLAGDSVALAVDQFRSVTGHSSQFRSIVVHHERTLLAQTQQSAACNASHKIEARLARWLLRARDLSGSDSIVLTQECLAQMLGVQRSSVSSVAQTLQEGGLIRYSRGRIEITNLKALQKASCECHAIV